MKTMLIFTKDSIGNGWSIFWRTLPITLIYAMINYWLKKQEGTGIFQLLAMLIIICTYIFVYDLLGKYLARKKYGLEIFDFIGWSISWRTAIMSMISGMVAMPLLSGIVILMMIAKKHSLNWLILVLGLFLVLIYLFAEILAIGWATTTVIKNKAKERPMV